MIEYLVVILFNFIWLYFFARDVFKKHIEAYKMYEFLTIYLFCYIGYGMAMIFLLAFFSDIMQSLVSKYSYQNNKLADFLNKNIF